MLVDGILALLVCINTYIHSLHHGPPVALAVLLVGALSLAARRHAPGPVLAVAVTSLVVFAVLGGDFVPLPFAMLIALHTVAWTFSLRTSLVAACLGAAGLAAAMAISHGSAEDDVLDRLPLVAAAWVLGYGGKLARERTALMEREAAQLRLEQETRTRLAVAEEQGRIARELHDVVAHHLTVIVAQATAVIRSRQVSTIAAPGEGTPVQRATRHDDQVLHTIAASGREALGELRRLLGALRPETEPSTAAFSPRLEQVRGLIDHVGRSGLPVELIVRGEPRPLPVSVETGAYRIIQEALTNALKHAGPTKAEVELDYQSDRLGLRISNGGGGTTDPSLAVGHGLLSMMQRAAVLGGDISVGPAHGQGFQVSAQLPVSEG